MVQNTGISSQTLLIYSQASDAETTAVATYDSTVSTAASAATPFVVVFNNALYAPPFNGNAVTTSE